MSKIDRRTLLYAFGIASVSSILPSQAAVAAKVAMCKPGESRFAFASAAQAQTSPCKVSSDDTNGACTIFELNALPRSGPFLHVHHREDEWYYVLSGEFIFRAGGEEHSLLTGASIWLPRGIPHVWANRRSPTWKSRWENTSSHCCAKANQRARNMPLRRAIRDSRSTPQT
jgi:quercetin dioxygenase-like cupin family protein